MKQLLRLPHPLLCSLERRFRGGVFHGYGGFADPFLQVSYGFFVFPLEKRGPFAAGRLFLAARFCLEPVGFLVQPEHFGNQSGLGLAGCTFPFVGFHFLGHGCTQAGLLHVIPAFLVGAHALHGLDILAGHSAGPGGHDLVGQGFLLGLAQLAALHPGQVGLAESQLAQAAVHAALRQFPGIGFTHPGGLPHRLSGARHLAFHDILPGGRGQRLVAHVFDLSSGCLPGVEERADDVGVGNAVAIGTVGLVIVVQERGHRG